MVKDKCIRVRNFFLLAMIIMYSMFLFYKVNTFPDVFLDEGNCMYDSWCMSKYGVDSNLMKNPIYLQGYIGQGQSILYPFIAGFSMKILGYHLFAYRIPIVVISILNYCLLVMIVKHRAGVNHALLTGIVLGTAPYILTVSRWGMDCNVAPFVASIGISILYYGYGMERSSKRRIFTIYLGGYCSGL